MDSREQRIQEIRDEVLANPRPRLGLHSIEDCDDAYQARLEWGWWRDEILDEWESLGMPREELHFIL